LHSKTLAKVVGHWWLTPVIPATQQAEVRRMRFEASPGKEFTGDPVLKKKKIHYKRWRVEWLKGKALSQSQPLYHVSHSATLFAFIIFQIGS
jgi:hypothetical protein